MVTKLRERQAYCQSSSYSSKNPYGNKTKVSDLKVATMSYSSKNPYGNKTSNTYYHIFD